MKQNMPLVITISRQLGSGGAYIGRRIAERLNMCYADREIICEAARKLSVLEADIESCDEKKASFWQSLLKTSPFTQDLYVPPKMKAPGDHELFETEAEIIEQIARKSPAVIIGRCGFHVLRSVPNHVSIFLHGDAESRCKRVQKLYDVSHGAAAKMIAQSDRERAAYCRAITGREWSDARNYDIAIDTGKAGVDGTVEFILHYLESVHGDS